MSKKKNISKSNSPTRSKQITSTGGNSPTSPGGPEYDYSKVKKNSNGGVLVTPEEIKSAFEFLDSDQSGRLTLANLKGKLGIFFPEMTAKDYRFLMNNKRELTIEDLNEILIDNEVTNFDPVLEAFKVIILSCYSK